MGAWASVKYHYFQCCFTYFVELDPTHCGFQLQGGSTIDQRERQSQVGSLAGAAHLLNDNAGVLRQAQWEQKSRVDQKGKSLLDFDFAKSSNCESMAYRSFRPGKFPARGVRKVTTGITGLWQPSVHSDVAFWSFDVGSSYHCEAEFAKRWIVHPLIGNVSWV